jgi:hypothetical protein
MGIDASKKERDSGASCRGDGRKLRCHPSMHSFSYEDMSQVMSMVAQITSLSQHLNDRNRQS